MKVLIKLKEPEINLLVNLPAKEIINEVLSCVNQGMYLNAIKIITEKGNVIRKVNKVELHLVEANLIITEKQAHFDLLVN